MLGIDFKNVGIVINFDFFILVLLYIYCVGWIVWVGCSGMVLFFVVLEKFYCKYVFIFVVMVENDEKVFKKIIKC